MNMDSKYIVSRVLLFILSISFLSCENEKHIADKDEKTPSSQSVNKNSDESIKDTNTTIKLHLKEIDLSKDLTKEKVLARWGEPAAVEGSGVEYSVYKLEDGRHLWLLFAQQLPQPLLKAIVFANVNGTTESETIFDGMDNTDLR